MLKIINNELKEFIWKFKKRIYPRDEDEEDEEEKVDDSDDEIDNNLYIAISSPNLCSFDNPVDVHNDIVRVLRREYLGHYSKF